MRIIVGIDGSAASSVAVRWVASLPLAMTDEVVVATVTDRPVLLGAWGYVDTEVNRTARDRAWMAAADEARRRTDVAIETLRGLHCQTRSLLLEGHPIEGLERAAREHAADLLVVGPRGRGGLESILLGSVSQSLLHAMPTAILVAREPMGPPRHVLLASDGSASSRAAATFLGRFPLPDDVTIEVLTALGGGPDWSAVEGAADLRDLGSAEHRHASAVNEPVLGTLEAAGRTATLTVREGDPKRVILAVARERGSQLVVMGARGLGGFKGLVLGSVSRAVSKAAQCSTLVVPERRSP